MGPNPARLLNSPVAGADAGSGTADAYAGAHTVAQDAAPRPDNGPWNAT